MCEATVLNQAKSGFLLGSAQRARLTVSGFCWLDVSLSKLQKILACQNLHRGSFLSRRQLAT